MFRGGTLLELADGSESWPHLSLRRPGNTPKRSGDPPPEPSLLADICKMNTICNNMSVIGSLCINHNWDLDKCCLLIHFLAWHGFGKEPRATVRRSSLLAAADLRCQMSRWRPVVPGRYCPRNFGAVTDSRMTGTWNGWMRSQYLFGWKVETGDSSCKLCFSTLKITLVVLEV